MTDTDLTATTVTLEDLTEDAYEIQVRANNSEGRGAWSSTIRAEQVPVIVGIRIISTPESGDTYGGGEIIKVEVTFMPVVVTCDLIWVRMVIRGKGHVKVLISYTEGRKIKNGKTSRERKTLLRDEPSRLDSVYPAPVSAGKFTAAGMQRTPYKNFVEQKAVCKLPADHCTTISVAKHDVRRKLHRTLYLPLGFSYKPLINKQL